MTDPNTSQLPDPQASVDAALNSAPAPTPVVPPALVPEPEPMQPPTTTTASSVPMGDDTPLAFVAPTDPVSSADNLGTSVPMDAIPPAPVPPVPISPAENVNTNKKSKVGLVIGGILALITTLGIGGFVSYQYLGYGKTPDIAIVSKQPGKITDPGDCNGASNGGWLVWRNGECKVTGTSGSVDKNNDGVGDKDTTNPNDKNIETMSQSECGATGTGTQWCSMYDTSGKPQGFCMKNDGSQGNCNNRAIEKGITVQIGEVGCKCTSNSRPCTSWGIDDTTKNKILNADTPETTKTAEIDSVNYQCQDQKGSFTTLGKESFICKEGVKGVGGTVYSGGACTELNGKPFTGSLGCFCGTVQVDTGTGHTSYSSTCGCDKEPKSSEPPSSNSPTMACTGLTSVPATVPAPTIGSVVKFTCAGIVTPSTAGTLTYKFRYSIDNGTFNNLTSTGATANLTINACGTYKVQCQACTTLNGVLTCDPNNWTGATQ